MLVVPVVFEVINGIEVMMGIIGIIMIIIGVIMIVIIIGGAVVGVAGMVIAAGAVMVAGAVMPVAAVVNDSGDGGLYNILIIMLIICQHRPNVLKPKPNDIWP